jgi:tetratricopeptide (TPR) repeat protein
MKPAALTSNRSGEGGEPAFIAEMRPDLEDKVDQALCQLEDGAVKEAGDRIKSLLQANPHYHTTNYAMGVYLAKVEEDFRAARPYFEKAVEIFPIFPEAQFNLGAAAIKTCKLPKAIAAFRAAARYSRPDDGIAEMARDQLRFIETTVLQGAPFKSLDDYLANARLFDEAFQCLTDRQFEQAAQMFQQVLDQVPNHVQSHGNLALAYAGLGKKAAALECLDKALALDPGYEPARINRLNIVTMREGEPGLRDGIEEINYYQDRFDEKGERRS